jgi:hypothetical protein
VYEASTCRDLYQLFGFLKSVNRGESSVTVWLYDVGGGRIEDGGAVWLNTPCVVYRNSCLINEAYTRSLSIFRVMARDECFGGLRQARFLVSIVTQTEIFFHFSRNTLILQHRMQRKTFSRCST